MGQCYEVRVAADDKGSRSCDVRSEVLGKLEVQLRMHVHFDINGRRLGPFEISECAADITGRLEPEACPERWSGYQDRTPVSADVSGGDQIQVTGAIFQYRR